MYIPKLRKIPQVVKEIKSRDKNSAVTDYLIYELIRKGEISQIKYGNAWLINLDELYNFFTKKEQTNEEDDNRTNI